MKKLLFLILLPILLITKLNAQIPPAKTWYENKYGQKTTVNEKWAEDNSSLKHGAYIKYYPDGEREILGNYTHGKKSGKWEFTNVNSFGGITSKSTYNYSNDLKNGEYQHINYSDNSIEKGFFTNDLKTGAWKEVHKVINGKIVYQEGNYLNGIRNGEWENTNARPYSQDEIRNYGYMLTYKDEYFQDANKREYALETTEGYRTIFSNGNIQGSFNPSGVNVLEQLLKAEALQKKQEEDAYNLKVAQQNQEKDFKSAMSKYYDNYSEKYYGDTTDLHTFLIKYPNANPSSIRKAKESIKNKSDNDAFYKIKSLEEFLDYEKNFPNGIHLTEVKTYLRDYTMSNKNTLRDDIVKDLKAGNVGDVIISCQLLLRYKDEFEEVHNQITVIYYSLALWSKNDTKAIEVIKPYINTTIHFSNMNSKFKTEYWYQYKIYKTTLGLENYKEIYKAIKAL